MRAGWFALGLAMVVLAAAAPLSCGEAFVIDSDAPVGGDGGKGGGTDKSSGSGSTSSGAQCMKDTDCKGPNFGCTHQKCDTGTCKTEYTNGKSPSQVYGDCQVTLCDGQGNASSQADDSDTYNDNNPCTEEKCEGGKLSSKPFASGTTCTTADPLGRFCDGTGACLECVVEMMTCASPATANTVCHENKCVPNGVGCTDNLLTATNGETDIDCGGTQCARCKDNKKCKSDGDCVSGRCLSISGSPKVCQPPSCKDGVKNGTETDLDCGGPACVSNQLPCDTGQSCAIGKDCLSSVCKDGKCQAPTCFDGVKNGDEKNTDCGGPCGSCE